MQDQEREALLTDLESDRVERKASPSDREVIRKSICAFANDLPDHRQPGAIFIGVNNDGSCADLEITDEMLRTFADMRSDGNILPLPVILVQKRSLRGCDVAVIEVQPSEHPPVQVRGRVWVRIGPSLRVATPEEVGRLSEKRRWHSVSADQQPVTGAALSDLNLDFFLREYLPVAVAPDILEANERSTELQLAALRFATPDGIPTTAGVLLLAHDVRQWIPGAYVQFLRIAGTQITDPVKDQKEIDGRLSDVLRRLDELLAINITEALEIVGHPVHVRRPDYPVEALRQLVRNAIMHRAYDNTNAPVRVYWFDDRIEIHNPGGPYGQVSPENFGEPGVTDYRNPVVAEAMRVLGYVQRFGFGIGIARKELKENGNPSPDFEVDPSHVVVTVRRIA